MRLSLLALCVVLFSGCQLPTWTVFQEKVPEPIVKSEEAKEVERQAADLIARKIEEPKELKPVAAKLSQSLGVPNEPLRNDNLLEASEKAVDSINEELVEVQEKRVKLNKQLSENSGKSIEGTGYNIFGFSMSLSMIALVVLCVMFPPLAMIVWKIFSGILGALKSTVSGINDYVKANPDQADRLKSYLKGKHDAAHKTIISKIKAKQ